MNGADADGKVVISIWESYADVGLPGGLEEFLGAAGGTTGGTVDVTFSVYKPGEALTGTALGSITLLGMTGVDYSDSNILNIMPAYTAFDLRMDIVITHPLEGAVTIAGAQMTAVPIPPSAFLFGSALIGVIAIGRRKSAQS